MKLSLKDNLKKFNLITEGWAENLSNKYSEDVLILVGRMLQMAYSNEDISNHPLAEWIAKTSKDLGELPWYEPNKSRNEDAYQTILKFVKNSGDDAEIVNNIKSKKAVQALKYVKDEIEKMNISEEPKITAEEELKEWLDNGYMKIIGAGPKGSVWVKPLKREFFDVALCGIGSDSSQIQGEFGVGCQRKVGGAIGAVGFHRNQSDGETYSLMTKGNKGYYTSIISFGGIPSQNKFAYSALQFMNKEIGSEAFGDWSGDEILEAFVNFLSNNSYGIKIYKPENLHEALSADGSLINSSDNLPGQLNSLTKEKNKKLLVKLAMNNSVFMNYYQKALKKLLKEEFDLLQIKARELYEKNPKEFINKISYYLTTEKQEAIEILSNINFKDFIEEYGQDVIIKNIEKILSIMNYKDFQDLIRPYISLENFYNQSSKSNLKEIIRNFSEKENSHQKTLNIINELFKSEKELKKVLEKFGNGNVENGLTAFLASLATPKKSEHQEYVKNLDGVTANVKVVKRNADGKMIHDNGTVLLDEAGNVYNEQGDLLYTLEHPNQEERSQYINNHKSYKTEEAKILPQNWILDYKNIRNFLKNNKDKIVNILGGGSKGEIKFIESFLRNSSQQERETEIKKIADEYISYYDKAYKEGKSDLIGILQYSKILSNLKMNVGGNITFVTASTMDSKLLNNFDKENLYIYNVDKNYLKDDKIRDKIINYYAKKSNRIDNKKIIDGTAAYFSTLKLSNFSPIDIEKKFRFFTNVFDKKFKFSTEEILDFIIIILEILPQNDVAVFKNFIEDNILSDKTDLGFKIQQSKEWRDTRTGELKSNKNIKDQLTKIKDIINQTKDLNEQKIRRYIQNLLYSNFRIK
jgi:hypothetical protein